MQLSTASHHARASAPLLARKHAHSAMPRLPLRSQHQRFNRSSCQNCSVTLGIAPALPARASGVSASTRLSPSLSFRAAITRGAMPLSWFRWAAGRAGGARGSDTALRGLTPWSEEADPDPEPYLRRRRTQAAPPAPPRPQSPYPSIPPSIPDARPSDAVPVDWQPPPVRGLTARADALDAPGAPPLVRVARVAAVDLLLPALCGSAVGYGLGLAVPQLGLMAALGVVGRQVIRALAATVPFTGRRHHLLVPLPLELAMGESSFRHFVAEQRAKGKVLSRRSKEHLLVAEVANTVIAAAMRGHGGGSQGHLKNFTWEVVTVEDDAANAFVLPGGKVVVYTGLIRLLGGRRDLLATVLGHEVAHALARHGTEKISLGIMAALGLRLLLAGATRATADRQSGGDGRGRQREYERYEQQRQQQQQQQQRGGYGGGYGGPAWPGAGGQTGREQGRRQPPPMFFGASDQDADDYRVGPGSLVSRLLEGAGASAASAAAEYARQAAAVAHGQGAASSLGGGRRPAGRLDPSHPFMSPDVGQLITNLLLQLPFSRRAESEADLIGLKLMALAGYDPRAAPETFRLLDAAEHGRHSHGLGALASPAAANAVRLGCTHPRSANRVRALEEEVRAMEEAGPQGYEIVYTHPSYWSL